MEMTATEHNNVTRSNVYRCFVRNQISTVPKQEKEKAKKFKEYEPGFLHIDVTYLPKLKGIKHYLFVAIEELHEPYFTRRMKIKRLNLRESF